MFFGDEFGVVMKGCRDYYIFFCFYSFNRKGILGSVFMGEGDRDIVLCCCCCVGWEI